MRVVLLVLCLLICPRAVAQSNDGWRDALLAGQNAYIGRDGARARAELARAASLAPTDPAGLAAYACRLGKIQYDWQDHALGERTLVAALSALRISAADAPDAEICLTGQLASAFRARGARAEAGVMAARAAALFLETRPERQRRIAFANNYMARLGSSLQLPDTDTPKARLLRVMLTELEPVGGRALIDALDRIAPPPRIEDLQSFMDALARRDGEAAARVQSARPDQAVRERQNLARERLLFAQSIASAGDFARALQWYDSGIAVLRGVRGEERLVFHAEAERVAILELLGRPGYARHAAGATLVLDASANLSTYDEAELAREDRYIRLAIEAGLEAVYTRTRY